MVDISLNADLFIHCLPRSKFGRFIQVDNLTLAVLSRYIYCIAVIKKVVTLVYRLPLSAQCVTRDGSHVYVVDVTNKLLVIDIDRLVENAKVGLSEDVTDGDPSGDEVESFLPNSLLHISHRQRLHLGFDCHAFVVLSSEPKVLLAVGTDGDNFVLRSVSVSLLDGNANVTAEHVLEACRSLESGLLVDTLRPCIKMVSLTRSDRPSIVVDKNLYSALVGGSSKMLESPVAVIGLSSGSVYVKSLLQIDIISLLSLEEGIIDIVGLKCQQISSECDVLCFIGNKGSILCLYYNDLTNSMCISEAFVLTKWMLRSAVGIGDLLCLCDKSFLRIYKVLYDGGHKLALALQTETPLPAVLDLLEYKGCVLALTGTGKLAVVDVCSVEKPQFESRRPSDAPPSERDSSLDMKLRHSLQGQLLVAANKLESSYKYLSRVNNDLDSVNDNIKVCQNLFKIFDCDRRLQDCETNILHVDGDTWRIKTNFKKLHIKRRNDWILIISIASIVTNVISYKTVTAEDEMSVDLNVDYNELPCSLSLYLCCMTRNLSWMPAGGQSLIQVYHKVLLPNMCASKPSTPSPIEVLQTICHAYHEAETDEDKAVPCPPSTVHSRDFVLPLDKSNIDTLLGAMKDISVSAVRDGVSSIHITGISRKNVSFTCLQVLLTLLDGLSSLSLCPLPNFDTLKEAIDTTGYELDNMISDPLSWIDDPITKITRLAETVTKSGLP